jgi:hypothetical protein
LPTEEAGPLLKEDERQRILRLNARTRAEETCREDEYLAINVEFTIRLRLAMIW